MDLLGTAGRWLAVILLLATLGIVTMLGIGRRRRTAPYRIRIALWVALLSLGGGSVLASSLATDEDPPGKSGDEQPPASGQSQPSPEPGVYYTCYDPTIIEGELTQPEATPPATAPDVTAQPPDDPDATSQPAEEESDVKSGPSARKPDAVEQPKPKPLGPIETCYYLML